MTRKTNIWSTNPQTVGRHLLSPDAASNNWCTWTLRWRTQFLCLAVDILSLYCSRCKSRAPLRKRGLEASFTETTWDRNELENIKGRCLPANTRRTRPIKLIPFGLGSLYIIGLLPKDDSRENTRRNGKET